MVDLFTGTAPNLAQSQPDFDENTQAILDYIAGFAPQLNEWIGAYIADTSSTSSTSHSIGTGSKVFTVEAGKGYKVNMTVRASATSGNFMDGIVTDYTGTSLTVNFQTATGSGTFASWNIFLTLTSSGDVVVPDSAYSESSWNGDLTVPTKNAIRDKIETIFGVSQTYQNYTASGRALGATYTNSTGRPIYVSVTLTSQTYQTLFNVTIDGGATRSFGRAEFPDGTTSYSNISIMVPNGGTYRFDGGTIYSWLELR